MNVLLFLTREQKSLFLVLLLCSCLRLARDVTTVTTDNFFTRSLLAAKLLIKKSLSLESSIEIFNYQNLQSSCILYNQRSSH
ncbi:hypothetical protein V1478_001691 [Vespula squamosa]|uniref:Secreted protein n=1 Tax=Vespula squamosa TaxID=30214 RepID=A0ABD2BYE3_VESSQ